MSYVIAAQPRTGSNFLTGALRNTKVLGKPSEFFNRPLIDRGLFEGADGSVETQCRIANGTATRPGGVCGMKIFPLQFDWISDHIHLEQWFPNIHWVWLRRRDALGQAISWEFAYQSNAWISLAKPERQPVYDFPKIAKRLATATLGDARWSHYFAAKGITPFELWFEDLPTGGLESAVRHLSEKADVVPASDWKAAIKIKRQTDSLKDAWRDRFLNEARIDPHPFLRASLVPDMKTLRQWLSSDVRLADFAIHARARR